jgi:thioredoxin reductase (NADPH)
MSSQSSLYDVVIIGGGVAGLSAALWCDELGLSALVLESAGEIGGQLLWIHNRIENHLGAEPVANGRELRDRIAEQIKTRNFQLRLNAKVVSVNLNEKKVQLENGEEISSRFLILATGVSRRRLNIPGETEFKGRGIIESGKRDGYLVTGKTVCIIGGGDAACENALILGEVAAQVYLIHRRAEFRARREFLDKIKQQPNVTVLTETNPLQILGKKAVEAIELERKDGSVFQIATDFILFRIGVAPNTELFRNQLETSPDGYVTVNYLSETSVPNVFATGDLANPTSPTISTATGTGATAAKTILARLAA